MSQVKVGGNFDEVFRHLNDAVDSFNFTLSGSAQKTLALDLIHAQALRIVGRSQQGEDPDGDLWRANERKYAAYKKRRYDVRLPGELGGQMLSPLSLVGKPNISPDQIEMNYGTDTLPPLESRNGVPLKKSERTLTDIEKAFFFTQGGRRFYEFGEGDAETLNAIVDDALEKHFKSRGY